MNWWNSTNMKNEQRIFVIQVFFFCFTTLKTIEGSFLFLDCYERMAIGQRLNEKDVFKTLEINTVQECQMACTEEREACRAFDFGYVIFYFLFAFEHMYESGRFKSWKLGTFLDWNLPKILADESLGYGPPGMMTCC